VRYQFLVRGQLSDTAKAAFPELDTALGPAGGGTTLWGAVQDESAVNGLLARFAALGITVVEMRQLPD
jgi:hypothetical protein